MAYSTIIFPLLFMIIFIFTAETAAKTCPKMNSYCSPTGSLTVRFPFQLTDDHDREYYSRCGYPGFNLSCNDSSGEAIISLPLAGDFTVKNIFYEYQMLTVDDPEECLPRRFLGKNFSVFGTPFRVISNLGRFTFLNCSSGYILGSDLVPVPCLSGGDYTVAAVPTVLFKSTPSFCKVISTALVPVISSNRWWEKDGGVYLRAYVALKWDEPRCRDCEMRGGDCGFVGDAGFQVGCFNLPRHGLSKGTQFALYFIGGLGIIGFLCFNYRRKCHLSRRGGSTIIIAGVLFSHSRNQIPNREVVAPTNNNVEVNPNTTGYTGVTGLDETIIESYPKTVVGAVESTRRLLKSNYSACPICLSEYQPKDTLRTLPDCLHYFHSDCIDEWLRLNATCPLCRNSPLISPYK